MYRAMAPPRRLALAPLLVFASAVQSSAGEVVKCCEHGSVLDDWYKCVPSEAANSTFLKALGINDTSPIIVKDPSATCKRRMRKEVHSELVDQNYDEDSYNYDYSVDAGYSSIATLNTTELDYGSYNDFYSESFNGSNPDQKDEPSFLDKFNSTDYHCMDLTLSTADLVVIECGLDTGTSGHLTKCCPREQLLSPDLTECVALPEGEPAHSLVTLLPPRWILDHSSLLPTGCVHEEHLTPAALCPGLRAQALPVMHVTTGGQALTDAGLTKIDCIDRQLTTSQMVTELAAVTCKVGVNKCCHEDNYLIRSETGELTCSMEFNNTFLQLDGITVSSNNNSQLSNLLVIPNFLQVKPFNQSKSFREYNMSVLEIVNKAVQLKDKPTENNFCIDNVLDSNGSFGTHVVGPAGLGRPETMNPAAPGVFPEIPDSPEQREECSTIFSIYTALGVLSFICLVATISIYALLPELRNLHGLIVMCCSISTLLATLYLLIIYNHAIVDGIEPTEPGPASSPGCAVLGYFGLFTNLSMFSWMAVMCYDLAVTFGRMRPVGTNRVSVKKFLFYSSFGWGAPLTISMFTLIFQLVADPSNSLNPRVGYWVQSRDSPSMRITCFVDDDESRIIFFHVPMLLFLLAVIGGFVYCLYMIHQTRVGAKQASVSRTSSRR